MKLDIKVYKDAFEDGSFCKVEVSLTQEEFLRMMSKSAMDFFEFSSWGLQRATSYGSQEENSASFIDKGNSNTIICKGELVIIPEEKDDERPGETGWEGA